MSLPCIIINAKAYRSGTGSAVVRLSRIAVQVSKKYRVQIAIAVQPQDIFSVAKTGIMALVQHVDAVGFGPFTGSIVPRGVKMAGAQGTLLNHSERVLSFSVLRDSLSVARNAGLLRVACAPSAFVAKKIAALKPDMIAIEPPELIGGKVGVSQAKPALITKTVQAIREIPVLCGAGIQSYEDVKKALVLGAQGILVSSAVMNAKNPRKVLEEFARAFTFSRGFSSSAHELINTTVS